MTVADGRKNSSVIGYPVVYDKKKCPTTTCLYKTYNKSVLRSLNAFTMGYLSKNFKCCIKFMWMIIYVRRLTDFISAYILMMSVKLREVYGRDQFFTIFIS